MITVYRNRRTVLTAKNEEVTRTLADPARMKIYRHVIAAAVAPQYPPRNYRLLAEIALGAIEKGRRPKKAAREAGLAGGWQQMAARGLTLDSLPAARLDSLKDLLDGEGLFARFSGGENGRLEVEVRHCIFREPPEGMDLVCSLHHSLVQGICESHLGKIGLTSQSGISKGGQNCRFLITLT